MHLGVGDPPRVERERDEEAGDRARATPMSNTARRDGIAERIRMTAPNVPTPNGTGMKNGSVESTPCARAMR